MDSFINIFRLNFMSLPCLPTRAAHLTYFIRLELTILLILRKV